MDKLTALRKAIKEAKGVTALAQQIGVAQSQVSMWLTRGQVSAKKCLAVEQAVNGAVTRHDLRPDIFGPAPH